MHTAVNRRMMPFNARVDDRPFRITLAVTALSVCTTSRQLRSAARLVAHRATFSTAPSSFALMCRVREAEPEGYW